MPEPIRNTHDHTLLSDRLLDFSDEADLMCRRLSRESADTDSPELQLIRRAIEEAEVLMRTLTRAATAAREGE